MAKRGKKRRERLYRVQTGTFNWKGVASSVDEAIVSAFARRLPKRLGELVRVHDGYVWWYIAPMAAFRIAGYAVRQFSDRIEVG